MKFNLVLLLLALALPVSASSQDHLKDLDDKLDTFLNAHVANGLVDYQAIKSQQNSLNEIVSKIGKTEESSLEGDRKKAFLINAYNILVIKNVVDHLPIKSPLEVEDFFTSKKHLVFGKSVSLDYLEKQMLFGEFPDPRLHFVLVCAAIGCPPIYSDPYSEAHLDAELDKATKAALNSSILVDLESEPESLLISELFSWYMTDFGGSQDGILNYISKHGKLQINRSKQLSFQKYNWALNSK